MSDLLTFWGDFYQYGDSHIGFSNLKYELLFAYNNYILTNINFYLI